MQRYLQIGAAIALATAMSACTSQSTMSDGASPMASAAKVCLNTLQIQKQTVLSDQDIQFEMNNGDVYVNHMNRRCSGLKIQGGFAWTVHNATVCSNEEIIQVLNDGTTCAIGEFVKQTKAT